MFFWFTGLSHVYFYVILSSCHQFFRPWRDHSVQKILASGGLKGIQIENETLVIDAMKMKGVKYSRVRGSPPGKSGRSCMRTRFNRELGEGSAGALTAEQGLWGRAFQLREQ